MQSFRIFWDFHTHSQYQFELGNKISILPLFSTVNFLEGLACCVWGGRSPCFAWKFYLSFLGVTDSKAVTGSKSTLDLSSAYSTSSIVVIVVGVVCGIILTSLIICLLVTCQKKVRSVLFISLSMIGVEIWESWLCLEMWDELRRSDKKTDIFTIFYVTAETIFGEKGTSGLDK